MSTENLENPVESADVDLDVFAAEFFGQKSAAPEQASSEDNKNDADESDANNKDTHSDAANPEDGDTDIEADTLAEEDEDTDVNDDNEGKDPDPDPIVAKPRRNRLQERIDELTAKFREEERKRIELETKIDELGKKPDKETTADPSKTEAQATGPQPTDLKEDGTEKYPLGEFDPSYIRDLTRFTLAEERKQEQEEKKAEEAKQKTEESWNTLRATWTDKITPFKEENPDFVEKGQQLISSFENIDASYGQYLEATIMGMDFGPEILYHLANNPDEAARIVQSGPTNATLALGALQTKFALAAEEKTKARPKVSNAPNPPAHQNKGSSVSAPEVPDDTDDLEAFSHKFFKNKRGG